MPERETVVLTYDGLPTSMNQSGWGRHWAQGYTEKKLWTNTLGALLMHAQVPRGLAHVEASAVLRFPVRRRRDEGNYWILDKALGDTLVTGLWLADDTPEFYKFTGVTFDPERGEPLTTVTLKYLAG